MKHCPSSEAEVFSTRQDKKFPEFYGTGRFITVFNPLKPTGYVMHHQLNIQQLCALPTPYLCILYLSENKQRLVPLTT
jgi:hypothetical protein